MTKDFRFWLIMLATCLVMLVSLGKRDLWDPDEPRYAQVAREMVERGDYLFMHINGHPYVDKPPLTFWATAFFANFTGGVDEWSARLLPALSGIFIVGLSMALANRMFGRRAALFTGIILATSYALVGQSRWVHMDMPLTAAMLVIFVLMYKGIFENGRPWLWLIAGILSAVVTLIKGPVVFVPAFVGLLYLLFVNVPKLPRARTWAIVLAACAFLGTILDGVGMLLFLIPCLTILVHTGGLRPLATRWFAFGVLALLVLVLAWLVPMVMQMNRELEGNAVEILSRQTVGRYVSFLSRPDEEMAQSAELKHFSHDIPHQAPFYYYYWTFPLMFLPWALALPSACAPIFRKGALDALEKKKRVFLFAIGIGVIMFFSFSSSKRELYALPAVPAFAILVSRYFDDLIAKGGLAKIARVTRMALSAFAALMAALALAFLAVIIHPPILYAVGGIFTKRVHEISDFVDASLTQAVPLAAASVLVLAAAFAAIWAIRQTRWGRAFVALAAISAIVTCVTEFVVYPQIVDQFKSARAFSEASFADIDGREFRWYGGDAREGVLFYGRRIIPEIANTDNGRSDYDELAAYLQDGTGQKFFVVQGEKYKSFCKANADGKYLKTPLYEWRRTMIGKKELMLISNRPRDAK